jgi:hypothetical protein
MAVTLNLHFSLQVGIVLSVELVSNCLGPHRVTWACLISLSKLCSLVSVNSVIWHKKCDSGGVPKRYYCCESSEELVVSESLSLPF